MRALLDTHAFLWWMADSGRLSEAAHRTIGDETNDILVSAASAWEIATKVRIGRLPEGEALALDIARHIAGQGFEEVGISIVDVERAGRLPGPHRDPFDRMLIAQALARDVAIVSVDSVFDRYGVARLWCRQRQLRTPRRPGAEAESRHRGDARSEFCVISPAERVMSGSG